MHDFTKYLSPTSIKVGCYEYANWKVRNIDDIRIAIKDGFPLSMHDELEGNQEDYLSLTHECWCDLLSTIKVKDNRSATHIKNIDSARAASCSDNDRSVSIPRKKKARTGFLCNNKGPDNKAPKHHCNQQHCVLCTKSGMPERKYMFHSAEDYYGKRSIQKTIKDGLERPMKKYVIICETV